MALTPGVELFIGWCHASQRTSNRAGIRTNFVLAGSSRRSHPPPSSTILHHPPPSSTKLHQPPPTSPTCPSLRQPVASTLGNGGTSRNHSPASREFLSTSTSNRSATRTTVAGRWRPT